MRLIDFIIAEDIRREIGNKVSIMGIFSEKMTLSPKPQSWPIPMRIGIFIRIHVEDKDKKPDKFSVKISINSNNVARMEGAISSTEKIRIIMLPLVINPLPIAGVGLLQFNFSLFSGDEILLEAQNELNIEVI